MVIFNLFFKNYIYVYYPNDVVTKVNIFSWNKQRNVKECTLCSHFRDCFKKLFLKFLFLQVSSHIQEALMTDWDYIFVNIYIYSSAVARCTDIHRAMNGRTSAAYGRPSGDGGRIYIVEGRNVSLLFIFYPLFVTNNTQYH